jgi:hypothetical protein
MNLKAQIKIPKDPAFSTEDSFIFKFNRFSRFQPFVTFLRPEIHRNGQER